MLFSSETLRKIWSLFSTSFIYQKISLFKYLSIAPLENCNQLFIPASMRIAFTGIISAFNEVACLSVWKRWGSAVILLSAGCKRKMVGVKLLKRYRNRFLSVFIVTDFLPGCDDLFCFPDVPKIFIQHIPYNSIITKEHPYVHVAVSWWNYQRVQTRNTTAMMHLPLCIHLNDPIRKPVSTINTTVNVLYKKCIKE